MIRAEQYRHVFRTGRRVRDAHFTVIGAPNATTGARLGLAVSRKAARRAVDRNRLKRQVRETFRQKQWQLRGLDVVVMARPTARNCPNATLRRHLNSLWHQLSYHATTADRSD